MRVVSSNNRQIVELLRSDRLARLGIDFVTAEHHTALEEIIRTKHPELAILDIELRGGSGLELCRAIRRDAGLNDVRVLLILPSILGRNDLDTLSSSGCDDVLALPLTEDDFFHHIVTLTGKRHRKNERVEVEVGVELEIDDQRIEAMAFNMSLGGLGVRLDAPLGDGAAVRVHLTHQGQTYPPARASVAWVREVAGDHLAGLSFAEVPLETRLLVEELCLFEVVESPLGGVRAYIHGDIIETTNLAPLAERLADANPVELNLRQVSYMSSVGTRNWCELISSLQGKRVWIRHASVAFVTQASLVPMVLGQAEVLSFEAPYLCENCDGDDVRLLGVGAIVRDGDEYIPPTLRCPTCGGELLFDELSWRYFAFLRGRDI